MLNAYNFSAVLMCHAPIAIPGIGGLHSAECQQTTSAMREAARQICLSEATTVIVISPHTPRHEARYGIVQGPVLHGSFAQFHRPDIFFNLPNALDLQEKLHAKIAAQKNNNLQVSPVYLDNLDHGSSVPLWFLVEAGYKGNVIVLGLPWNTSSESNYLLGKILAEFIEKSDKKIALIASGDMSHSLTASSPAGYKPQAKEFDAQVVHVVKEGNYSELAKINPELRESAAEDVIDSLEIAFSALNWQSKNHVFLSYEAPFGVGYLVSVLHKTMNNR